jgi:hypothetical protein
MPLEPHPTDPNKLIMRAGNYNLPVACRFCHDKKGCWAWQCYHCGEIDDVQQPAAKPEQQAEPCIGKDPRCPCQDGDACHYKDCGRTKAWPVQRQWVGLTEQDMPSGEDPMFDHQYFIAGMVYAAKVLQEKNT